MATKTNRQAADYIRPLSMNGLNGRVLRMPAPKNKKREIMLIYGHHSSLERMFGFIEVLNSYGAVTMPDLPGFGGMTPLYNIGEKPSVDNLADYLASFVKMRYRGRKFTVIGMSYGFVIVTRMLQKYPELAEKVDILISFVGLTNKDDFGVKKRNFLFFKYCSRILSNRFLSAIGQHFVLRGPFIRFSYKLVEDKHSKLQDASREVRKERIDFEIMLWQCNDLRTYLYSASEMFRLDLSDIKVDKKVYNIGVVNDRYLDNNMVEINMKRIFKDFEFVKSKMPNHAPTVIANAKEASPYVPGKIRQLLRRAA